MHHLFKDFFSGTTAFLRYETMLADFKAKLKMIAIAQVYTKQTTSERKCY